MFTSYGTRLKKASLVIAKITTNFAEKKKESRNETAKKYMNTYLSFMFFRLELPYIRGQESKGVTIFLLANSVI